MPSFFTSYVQAALFSSTDDNETPLDKNYTAANIAADTLAKMREDCEAFTKANRTDLKGMTPGQAGHDFWMTRNGAGVGYWMRELGEAGDRLTKASEAFGMFDLYIGDDGQVHGSPL